MKLRKLVISGALVLALLMLVVVAVVVGHTGKTNTAVVGSNHRLAITTKVLPRGVAGSRYGAVLTARGGRSPYSWSATGLPPGLSVVGGSIRGTPTAGGGGAPATYQIQGKSKLESLVGAGLTPAALAYLFDQPKSFIPVGANGQDAASTAAELASVHTSWPRAQPTWLFNSVGVNTLTSQPGIAGVFGAGGVYGPGRPNPPGLTAIMYDCEGAANGTPDTESAALETGKLTFIVQAAAIAHAKGLSFLLTPSAASGMTSGEGGANRFKTWLEQDRGRFAGASGVDFYSVQSQQAEGTPEWDAFVPAAIAQSKAAAPGVPVFVGIGINPSHPPTVITPTILRYSHDSALAAGAVGFWQNLQQNVGANVPTSVYVTFLNQLYLDSVGRSGGARTYPVIVRVEDGAKATATSRLDLVVS